MLQDFKSNYLFQCGYILEVVLHLLVISCEFLSHFYCVSKTPRTHESLWGDVSAVTSITFLLHCTGWSACYYEQMVMMTNNT